MICAVLVCLTGALAVSSVRLQAKNAQYKAQEAELEEQIREEKERAGEIDEFEEYVCEILKRNGYKQVKLTRRTGDYGVDILASDKHYRYAIQCKYYSKPVGVSAVQQAYSGCQYYECDIPVVVTNHTFTSQAQKLAVTNGVKLWDGEILKRMKAKANAKSLFHRFPKESHPYASIIHLIYQEGYASDELLHEHLDISLSKAYYILDDLEFYDLVSKEDEYGIRELYFESEEEALEKLDF